MGNQKEQIKQLICELESERISLKEKLERERNKFELKPVVQELRKLSEKHTKLKMNIEKERKDMGNQISLLTVNNSKLEATLKASEKETNIVKMTATNNILRNELHHAQELLKQEEKIKQILVLNYIHF